MGPTASVLFGFKGQSKTAGTKSRVNLGSYEIFNLTASHSFGCVCVDLLFLFLLCEFEMPLKKPRTGTFFFFK